MENELVSGGKMIFSRIIESGESLLKNEERFESAVLHEFKSNSDLSEAIILLNQLGIVYEINKAKRLTRSLYSDFYYSLTTKYGINNEVAKYAVFLWFEVYGIDHCHKPSEVSIEILDTSGTTNTGKNMTPGAREKSLIGKRVRNNTSHEIGIITEIKNSFITVDFHGVIRRYPYPAVFASILEIEDVDIQEGLENEGIGASFEDFKRIYRNAINHEIDYLKVTGGKKYRIIDGEKLPSKGGEYLYAFETDTDLHFPDGTAIKLWFPENIIIGYVVSCEDFTILIRTTEYIGEFVECVDVTTEQWRLLETLMDRLDEMCPSSGSLAYEIATNGRKQITKWQKIKCGQNLAFNRATSEGITIIWGPPGTGKTETLANIALEHIENGKRVLMLSYSNVSVDGALLRVAKKADLKEGQIIRYGYPRTKELLESKTLTAYQYVLQMYPSWTARYQELSELKKRLKRKDPVRLEVNRELNKIRDFLLEKEIEVIQAASFVATTVSKATVDRAVYQQRFDVVIFDEASMAYVPQIVFAAGLAKKHFVCLGDFCQLPAIVQNKTDERLSQDIFEYTGITSAVEHDQGHNWLVMLNEQYRMHQSISDFVSEHMYKGRLVTSERIIESREEIAACHPCPNAAMSMVDLSGMYSVCTRTMDESRINILSAFMSLRLAEKNIDMYEIGIITPYSAQSRLVLSMIRDLQDLDEKWRRVSCATVHQFQGSEKPFIIYDAVDCFRMPYPGMLLTSMKNDTANRLFNVALTRAKGKFVLLANVDYMKRKHISPKLIFTKAIDRIRSERNVLLGNNVLDEMMPGKKENPVVFIEERDITWNLYIQDLLKAKIRIQIDMPDVIAGNDETIRKLIRVLHDKKEENLEISIRLPEEVDLPNELQEFVKPHPYVTTPVTLIDRRTIWFGHPLYAADFISEGEILDTEWFPCVRFQGTHTARSVQAFLGM